jgi:hypothetical protein
MAISSTPVSANEIVEATKAECISLDLEINERVKSDENFSLTQKEIAFLVDEC